MTVRQAYYAIEVAGVIEKTEGGYRQVQREMLRMRREGLLPWSFVADGTRWQRKPDSYADADPELYQHRRPPVPGVICGSAKTCGSSSGWRRTRSPT